LFNASYASGLNYEVESRMQPARASSFLTPRVNRTCCRNSRIIIVASFWTNLLSP